MQNFRNIYCLFCETGKEEVAQALNVPMTCTLLYITEVGYDLHSNPLLYSEEYFLDRVIPQIIVRKKI